MFSINDSSSFDQPHWTQYHAVVGASVASHFIDHNQKLKLFVGKVVKYLPPSKSYRYDQLYHIEWSDGDEEDYDLEDLVRGMDLHDESFGWLKKHPSVGKECATYLSGFNAYGKAASVLCRGVVVQFKP